MNALTQWTGIDLSDRHTRALAMCIVASLVLHALALFLFPGLREGKPPAASTMVLTARIAPASEFRNRPEPRVETKPEVKPEVRQEVKPPPVPPKPEAPRPVLTAPTPAPAAPRVADVAPPSPPPAPATPPPAAAPSPPAATAPAPSASTAPPAPAAARPAEPSTSTAGTEGVDAGSVDRFRMEILAATRRYKRYPAQAMERGWQGRVEIRLVIGANGMTQSYTVKTSSGFTLLDETAMDMVKKGRPLVPVPPALRGREFTIDVPVIFDLKAG